MRKKNAKSVTSKQYRLVVFFLVVSILSLSGCSSMAYYGQSVVGHSRLMLSREPLDDVIESADPALKSRLMLAQQMRQFAVRNLALPDNSSYSTYVDLERDYPVWTVVAAKEFSVVPKSWCYPVIGCASYRGYFSQQSASNYADTLQAKGFETSVGGASAYSTLGWFSDPLLPSMMRYTNADLAEVLFHELAHQVLYVNGNSSFNEAFASVVGEQGALLWLQQHEPKSLQAYKQNLLISNQFSLLLRETKDALAILYALPLSENEMRLQKKELINDLYERYTTAKLTRWSGQSNYDHWFTTPVNNARLAAVSTYRDYMPPLERLLEECEFDFGLFFGTLKRAIDKQHPATLLENLPPVCESPS